MARERSQLEKHVAANRRNTVLLLAYLVGIVVLLFGGLTGTWQGAATGLVIVVVYILATFPLSSEAILLACRARKADPSKLRERRLIELVDRLASAAGMPVPRVYVEPANGLNAFAVGVTPRRSAVCVTRGALDQFTEAELAGVIGHELGHIRDRDTLVKTVAFGVVGALGLIAAALAAFAVAVLAMPVEGKDDGEKLMGHALKIGTAMMLFALAALTFVFLLLARLGYFAISRNREYLADATSAELNGATNGLRSALMKLAEDPHVPTKRQKAMASLYLASPAESSFLGLLETHPPIAKRIERLEKLTGAPPVQTQPEAPPRADILQPPPLGSKRIASGPPRREH